MTLPKLAIFFSDFLDSTVVALKIISLCFGVTRSICSWETLNGHHDKMLPRHLIHQPAITPSTTIVATSCEHLLLVDDMSLNKVGVGSCENQLSVSTRAKRKRSLPLCLAPEKQRIAFMSTNIFMTVTGYVMITLVGLIILL